MDWTDTEYEDHIIARAEPGSDGLWTVSLDDGGCIGVENPPFAPAPGMSIRLYGRGFGYPVRGIILDGAVVRYQTETEHRVESERKEAEWKAKKYAEFEQRRPEVEARIAALPPLFRARFDRFMAGNPTFLPDYGEYELLCCEQAIAFAARMDANELRQWAKEPWDVQKAAMPELDEGHSGNTFGMSVRLALLLREQPDLVPLWHGALTPLVGCEAYGCTHETAAA